MNDKQQRGLKPTLRLLYFQINYIRLDGKIIIILGLVIIILQSLDYFFLELILTQKNLYVKSIFTLGKLIKIDLKKIKSIKVSNVYFKDKLKQGTIILTMHKKLPIPLGIIKDANDFKTIFENTQKLSI